jgi:hypothetical protein
MITYFRSPGGQIDEQVSPPVKKFKTKDMQTCNVILDYKERKVVKCVIEGKIVPTDFERLNDYYKQHHPQIIEQLELIQKTE